MLVATVRVGELTGVTEIIAEADFVGSATLVALTVALLATLVVGAVKTPLVDTVPALVLQVTWVLVLDPVVVAVLVPPLTVAVSSCVAPETTVAVVGVTLTVMLGSVAATVKRNPRVSKNVRLADKARTVKLKVLARTGTPEIMPVVELKASPAGSVPEEME